MDLVLSKNTDLKETALYTIQGGFLLLKPGSSVPIVLEAIPPCITVDTF